MDRRNGWAQEDSNIRDVPWHAEQYMELQHLPSLDLKNHLKGRRHQEDVEQKQIQENGGFQEAESCEKKPQQLADKNKRPASRWNCNMCKVSCTSESNLDSHLKGRRHQQNVKAQLIENNTVLESLVGRKKQQLIGIC
jgi:hypothetical protein